MKLDSAPDGKLHQFTVHQLVVVAVRQAQQFLSRVGALFVQQLHEIHLPGLLAWILPLPV